MAGESAAGQVFSQLTPRQWAIVGVAGVGIGLLWRRFRPQAPAEPAAEAETWTSESVGSGLVGAAAGSSGPAAIGGPPSQSTAASPYPYAEVVRSGLVTGDPTEFVTALDELTGRAFPRSEDSAYRAQVAATVRANTSAAVVRLAGVSEAEARRYATENGVNVDVITDDGRQLTIPAVAAPNYTGPSNKVRYRTPSGIIVETIAGSEEPAPPGSVVIEAPPNYVLPIQSTTTPAAPTAPVTPGAGTPSTPTPAAAQKAALQAQLAGLVAQQNAYMAANGGKGSSELFLQAMSLQRQIDQL